MSNIYEDLIVMGVDAQDAEDAIRQVGQYLLKGGYVKDTYIDAVAQREVEYPTGLQLRKAGIAMPHTAGIHVNRPAVCVARLAHPVTFCHMGDPDTKVEAEMLFMMAIQNPDEQIDTLAKVMGVFVNDAAVEELLSAPDHASLYRVAQTHLG